MLSNNKFYFLSVLFVIFMISRIFSDNSGSIEEFHDKVFVKKELLSKLQEWKEWKRSWYGLYPQNKSALFEDSDDWIMARLVEYEVLAIKSYMNSSIFISTDHGSISSIALVKVKLKVAGKIYIRYIEYHLYKVVDTLMFKGLDWRVTESSMYDSDEIKSQAIWSDFYNVKEISF